MFVISGGLPFCAFTGGKPQSVKWIGKMLSRFSGSRVFTFLEILFFCGKQKAHAIPTPPAL
jgi:hypothetical protein